MLNVVQRDIHTNENEAVLKVVGRGMQVSENEAVLGKWTHHPSFIRNLRAETEQREHVLNGAAAAYDG